MSEAGASPSTGITRLQQYHMTPSDFRTVRPPKETFGLLSRRTRISPVAHKPFSGMLSPLPRWTGWVHSSITFPIRWSLPRVRGGSASTRTFSRPAQRLHVTACRTARPPTAAFVTRRRPGSCPPTVARQLPSPIDFGSCGLFLPLGSMIVSGHTPTYAARSAADVYAVKPAPRTSAPRRSSARSARCPWSIPRTASSGGRCRVGSSSCRRAS